LTIEHPIEDEVAQLARRVEKARGRLAYQFDPALTEALSEDELHAERELAEKIRGQERDQRWKHVQAAASASDRARHTTEAIEKADIRDLLVARKAIAAQRRESSPHAKLASLYRHRAWSLRALAGVVAAGMLWSAVNVQQNIAPGGPGDPLYWFSYLIEAMISVCLIIIMVGTNKVAEWGILDSRRQVVSAEIALLTLTVGLNTYPYVRDGHWYDAAVHAVAPVMIGVALLIHDAASARYGHAISQATEQVRELPDPADLIRRSFPTVASFRTIGRPEMVTPGAPPAALEQGRGAEAHPIEAGAEADVIPDDDVIPPVDYEAIPTSALKVDDTDAVFRRDDRFSTPVAAVKVEKRRAPVNSGRSTAESRPVAPVKAKEPVAPATVKSKATAEKNGTPTKAESKLVTSVSSPDLAAPGKANARQTAAAKTEKAVAPVDVDTVTAPTPAISRSTGADTKPASASTDAKAGAETASTPESYDTGQFRVAEILEQELAELQAERRRARTSRQR
jgi:hypothetical protein